MEIGNLVARRDEAWFVYKKDGQEFRVKLRHLSVPKLDLLQRKCRPPKPISESDVVLERMAKELSRQVLVDWDGLEENGGAVPFSRETAEALLSHVHFHNWVIEKATTVADYLGNGEGPDGSA